MRFLRGNSIRFIVLPVLFAISFILFPQTSHGRDSSLEKIEIQAMYDVGQFGEPGHDPFLWRHGPGEPGSPGGNNREAHTIPGSGQNGDGQGEALSSEWDIEEIIRILGRTLVRTISQQF